VKRGQRHSEPPPIEGMVMSVEVNHIIIWCHNKQRSSALLARILGCPPAKPFYNFMVVRLANSVSMDFMDTTGPIAGQHYAFLLEEGEFEQRSHEFATKG
jgi:hypothetical protein